MDEAAKKRLIGAVVLVLLMVIFVPMLFEEPAPPAPDEGSVVQVPGEPAFQSRPAGEVFLSPTAPGLDERSLGVDEMGPIDALTSDEAASFAAEEPAPSGDPRPVGPPAPFEPVAEPASRDWPAPVASRPLPSAAPPVQTTPPTSATTPAPAVAAAVRSGSFVVQVAALSTAERAAALADELRRHGFSSFTQRAEVGGKIYFRVRVGPEPDRAAAERLAAAVKGKTGHQGQVLVQ